MREVGGQSELWLVKAGDRILGPFDHTEIVRKLLSREFAVIDEIAKPLGRWKYVREEPAFRAIVEQIRTENLNARDDTMATITTTATTVDPFDLTPTPTQVESQPTSVATQSIAGSKELPAKRYGLHNDPVEQPKRSLWSVVVVILVSASVFGFWFIKNRSGHGHALPGASFSSLKNTGFHAISSGEYREALKVLKEAQNLNTSDSDVQLALASMMLKVEGQTAAARRLVGEIQNPNEEQKKKSDLILSFADLLENEPSQAVERLKPYAQADDDIDRAIAFNKSVALEATKQSREAKQTIQSILSDHRYGPPARLLLALMTANSNQEIALENLKPVIDQGTFRPRPFQQESLVIQAYLQMKAKNLKSAEAAITSALNSDPYATSAFTYEPALYIQAINWVKLRTYCQQLETEFPKLVEAKTLLAICELKSDRQARALELMNEALAQAPQDQLLLANNAYLLLEFGKDDEAKGSLRLAMRNSDSMQTLVLMAKACSESGDVICERESYKKILHLDPNHLSALVGLAELELKSGDAEEALKHYKEGAALDPSFAPLLRLKEKLP